MEETSDSMGSHDSGRYDNDFEKLPGDTEEVNSTGEPLARPGSPSGDAKKPELATHGDESSPSTSKSQLNVEETKPQPTTCDARSDEGAVCASCCFMTRTIDPRVKELLLWRDVKKSGVVFGASLVVFLSLALCSIISVISYLSLAVLTMTASFRIYHLIMAAVKKTEATNPFRKYLETDLKFPDDVAHRYGDIVAKHVTHTADSFRRLIFVDDLVNTLKFALLMWLLTFIGGWFNGMTLIIIADILLFTVPKVYDMYQSQIDETCKKISVKLQDLWKQVEEKVPILGKKKQA